MDDPQLPGDHPGALAAVIARHPFCTGLDAGHVRALADGAAFLAFTAGSFVLRRGHDATHLHLITDGLVALELAEDGQQAVVVETLQAGDTMGWSWLYPHRSWSFDARCVTDVRTVSVDADHLRRLMDADPALDREVGLRVGRLVVDRLLHTQRRALEVGRHDRD